MTVTDALLNYLPGIAMALVVIVTVRYVRSYSSDDSFFTPAIRWAPHAWPKEPAHKLRAVLCILITLAGRVFQVAKPLLLKRVVDDLADKRPLNWPALLSLVALGYSQDVCDNLFEVLWFPVARSTHKRLTLETFEHVHSLSIDWHLRQRGDVIRSIERGADSVDGLLQRLLFDIIPCLLDVAIGVTYLATQLTPSLGAVTLLTMAAYVYTTNLLSSTHKENRRLANTTNDRVRTVAHGSFTAFETVKNFTAEERELHRLTKAVEDHEASCWRRRISASSMRMVQKFVRVTGVGIGLVVTAVQVSQGLLSVGSFTLVASYMRQIMSPVSDMSLIYRDLQNAFVDLEKLEALLDEKPSVVDCVHARKADFKLEGGCGGEIRFENVHFHYDAAQPVLRGVSFHIRSGTTVALVGPSGAGKSTIVRMVLRLYDATEGSVFVNGTDVRQLAQGSLRAGMSVVAQETMLFNETLDYNVRYGRPEADTTEVIQAMRGAALHDTVVSRFALGYNTVVGERGTRLSGGERQRVAIARAILRDTPILLLDEATSSLDTLTERDIQQALRGACVNRTTLVVAHRLSTIMHADEILVLEHGQITERGRHDDLLAIDGGTYAKMWGEQRITEKNHSAV